MALSTFFLMTAHPHTMYFSTVKFGNGVYGSLGGDRGQSKCQTKEPE
jgi:hypothetical protein